MRVTLATLASVIVAWGAIGAPPGIAQTRTTSLEELRRGLAAGDFVTLVPAAGASVAGRLTRVGTVDIASRLV
jgi:hypothetical protein